MSEGIVLKAGRGTYIVQTDTGRIIPCLLRGNLKKNLTYPESTNRRHRVEQAKKRRETDPIAVGDRVDVTEEEGGRGVIEVLHPRRRSLSRQSGNERERQTIVANLELAVVVFAAREPNPDLWKLDRFLVLAEDAELDLLIVLNKADLAPPEEIEAVAEPYRRIGYGVVAASARTGIGIDELRARLKGRISAFCGPSGAGKSSLLNAVQPGLELKTGDIGNVTWKGRHTTVSTELLPLSFGGWVADTPGLRQVEFWDLATEDVGFCFPEMRPFLGNCRFADCRHRTEPDCAIRAALARGDIDQRRYESYLEMTK
uniref:Small ribosomal subunit biogenesis GTPase RsgA n=1 Tax=uncultured Armatimonadetes bacterium TaxID=157466 RepID=A0A6J4K1Y6_9BACT|nr:Ribosome small subunit biogenesis RbfA-release protein RsgA [uncultured Armatimonadetes bacterium]